MREKYMKTGVMSLVIVQIGFALGLAASPAFASSKAYTFSCPNAGTIVLVPNSRAIRDGVQYYSHLSAESQDGYWLIQLFDAHTGAAVQALTDCTTSDLPDLPPAHFARASSRTVEDSPGGFSEGRCILLGGCSCANGNRIVINGSCN